MCAATTDMPRDVVEGLLPCPFCGGPPVLFGTKFEGYLGCTNDHCSIQPSVYSKRLARGDNLVAAWNRRDAPPEALTTAHATIAELTAANQALVAQMGSAVDAAVRQEREACAVIADTMAVQNKAAAIRTRQRANRLGNDPFGHGDTAASAAFEMEAAQHECQALAAAIRARAETIIGEMK